MSEYMLATDKEKRVQQILQERSQRLVIFFRGSSKWKKLWPMT